MLQQEIATHRAAVQSVICSRDGRTLASASDDRTIQLRSVETGELLLTLTGHTDGVVQVAFSPDGRRLVSTSWDKTIRIWDVTSGELLRTIDKTESAVRSVVFSPDGRRLVSGGEDHTIRLWDAETGVELATLRGHQGSVTSAAFSSDGRILASASADKTVMMWELEEVSPAKPAEPPAPATVDRKPVKIPSAPPQEPPLAIAPFDAAQAKQHQEAWAEYLGVPVEFENSIGMKFVLIPPGEFDMGSTEEEVAILLEEARATNQPGWYIGRPPSEAPRHRVSHGPEFVKMQPVNAKMDERGRAADRLSQLADVLPRAFVQGNTRAHLGTLNDVFASCFGFAEQHHQHILLRRRHPSRDRRGPRRGARHSGRSRYSSLEFC